jgi:hypothetical protein
LVLLLLAGRWWRFEFPIFFPVRAGLQLLVVVFSTLQTGGSAKVQHDLLQVVDSQLFTTPLIAFRVLVGHRMSLRHTASRRHPQPVNEWASEPHFG